MERALQVLTICLPVFALIGLGILLRRSGRMNDDHQRFLTWFINTLCLPALIFVNVASEDFARLINLPVIAATLGATLIAALIGLGVARGARLAPAFAGPAIFGGYWANVTYLGFPLAQSAYGDLGLTIGSVVNAFTMPVFVASGIVICHLLHHDADLGWRQILRRVFSNPIILAALLGILTALIGLWPPLRNALAISDDGAVPMTRHLIDMIAASLRLLGGPGLALALVAIGYGLRWHTVRDHRALLAFTVIAKTLVTPLVTLLILTLLFPAIPAADRGVAVMMMATPCAVACYVIGSQEGANGPFLAAHLTLSTAIACISIPLWLYWVL